MRHQHAPLVVDEGLELEVPAAPPWHRFAPALRRAWIAPATYAAAFPARKR